VKMIFLDFLNSSSWKRSLS